MRPGSPNRRRNVSGLVRFRDEAGAVRHVQIDCGKGFWEGALQWYPAHGISGLDALLITHAHADQMGGLDDLRDVTLRITKGPLPLYAAGPHLEQIKRVYPYLFDGVSHARGGGVTNLEPRTFGAGPFQVAGLECRPIPVWHGRDYLSYGFRFGSCAWIADISAWPDNTPWSLVEGLDLLVLDALRPRPHPTHFHLEQSLDFVRRVRPKRTLLVDMTHDFEHGAANSDLAAWGAGEGLDVQLAADGMKVEI
jgi:phosphoribosyl 1,2-cyclic phosphodiesterase